MEKVKCITFDKEAQNALPEHIKTKMQAHKDRAILQRQVANSLPYILQFPNKDLIEILEKATLIMKMQ